jgi:hypothetical protein
MRPALVSKETYTYVSREQLLAAGGVCAHTLPLAWTAEALLLAAHV